MPLGPTDYQNFIISELNLTAYPAVQANVPNYWTFYQDKGLLPDGIKLQYLYTKRHCIDALLGSYFTNTDYTADVESKDSQISAQLAVMRATLEAEILRVEAMARGLRLPVTGAITTSAPVSVPSGGPDPGDSVYRGDPLKSDGQQTRP